MEGGVGKNRTTVAETSVISPGVPFFLLLSCALYVLNQSPSQLYLNHPIFFLLAFGFVFSKLTSNLVVAHMTKYAIPLLDPSFVGPAVLLVNQYLHCPIPEYICLMFAL
ncbi:Cholinephosphotransferase 1, partial [Cichlidogyrus casuarinus]